MWHSVCRSDDVAQLVPEFASMTTTDPRVVRTRQRALDAGARLLLETGIDAVTHAQVAEVAGVGRRTLYRTGRIDVRWCGMCCP